MRAYHMPSLPEMPMQHYHNDGIGEFTQMKLKILYALDDNTNFLARSPSLVKVKTARIPIPGQQNIMTLGVVSIKDALSPVYSSSPELFSDSVWDYSIYVKDVSEEDEPFVGHGLISKLVGINDQDIDDEIMIPGRVCSNFAALLSSKGPSETLEIRLKFVKVKRQDQLQQFPFQQEIQNLSQHPSPQPPSQPSQPPSQPSKPTSSRPSIFKTQGSKQLQQRSNSDTDEEEEEKNDVVDDTFIQPKPMNSSNLPKMNRFVNNNPAPKAARTQSLPVFENMMKQPTGKPIQKFPTDSIARRIYMADKLNGNKIGDKTSNIDNNIAKRFASDFIKDKKVEPKKKVRKTAIPTSTKTKTPKSTIPEEHQLYQSCFNCKTMEAKGWKWNESDDLSKRGLLCSLCYSYLKERGIMRPRKLYKNTARVYKDKTPKIASSSPSSGLGSDLNTPTFQNMKNLPSSSAYDNSSDPLNGFEEMVNDLELQFGPLTDIDPLPQQDDKENVPPKSLSIVRQLQEYHEQKQNNSNSNSPLNLAKQPKNQTAFEKMLTKSFSGAILATSTSPQDWMSTLFENVEPTPKDATPKDSPKDITTCNTLPCNEESPEGKEEEEVEEKKPSTTTMPSSPFPSNDQAESSSPTNGEEWLMSDSTKLNSTNDLPSKELQAQNDHFDPFNLVK